MLKMTSWINSVKVLDYSHCISARIIYILNVGNRLIIRYLMVSALAHDGSE